MTSIPKLQKASFIDSNSELPDGIKYGDLESPQISDPHDIIIKANFAGVNFIDSYFRKGIYNVSKFPHIFGREASGIVAAVGDQVVDYKVGDKVIYLGPDSFAQYIKVQDSYLTLSKVQGDSSDDELKLYVASLLQGLTALTLTEESYKVKKGDTALVWAASGGVGLLLVQILKQLGATVIAISSTEEKLNNVKQYGADYLINSSSDDITHKVLQITDGKGVDVSYDSVGKDSFQTSLDSIRRKGTFVSYGNASGAVPPFSISILGPKAICLLRPQLYAYLQTKEEWQYYSSKLFSMVKSNELKIAIYKTYPLKDYADATSDLENRLTSGKLILSIPQ